MPGAIISSGGVGWVVECAEPLVGVLERQNSPHTLARDTLYTCVVMMVAWVCIGVEVLMADATADVSHGHRSCMRRAATRDTRRMQLKLAR